MRSGFVLVVVLVLVLGLFGVIENDDEDDAPTACAPEETA
jgi:hypothetical protein